MKKLFVCCSLALLAGCTASPVVNGIASGFDSKAYKEYVVTEQTLSELKYCDPTYEHISAVQEYYHKQAEAKRLMSGQVSMLVGDEPRDIWLLDCEGAKENAIRYVTTGKLRAPGI